MWYTKRAVNTVAVVESMIVARATGLPVAGLAEPVRAEAVVNSNGAAEHAFPVDLEVAVLCTGLLPCTVSLHLAIPAAKVLLAELILVVEGSSTIDHAAEVRLLAVVALVEGAIVHGEFEELAFVVVARASEALIFVEALVLGHIESDLMNALAKLVKFFELSLNLLAPCLSDLLLAARAVHEGEVDLERAPAGLEEHLDAICVEDVATAELHAGLRLKLARVADRAELAS